MKSNYNIVMPLFEKHGFTGWVFIQVGLISAGRCKDFHYTGNEKCSYMSWNEIAGLNKYHIIGCHTLTHCRLSNPISDKKLKQEIVDSKKILEDKLNKRIISFVGLVEKKKHILQKQQNISVRLVINILS